MLGQARGLLGGAEQDADFLAQKQETVKKLADGDLIEQRQNELEGDQDQLAGVLRQLFELFGDGDAMERLTAARTEVEQRLTDNVLDSTETGPLLASVRSKYQMTTLEIRPQGEERVEVFGEINPKFTFYANQIPIIDRGAVDESIKTELQTIYRSVGIKELKRILANQRLRRFPKRGGYFEAVAPETAMSS